MEAAIRAIAEPRRREILRLVWTSELAAGEIARHFDVTRPAISQHLRVLKDAGLVRSRRAGRQNLYRLEAAPLREVFDWVSFYQRFWGERLEALGRYLDRKAKQEGGARKR
jgi:DNA-binding transcriptional ArsR family regulator